MLTESTDNIEDMMKKQRVKIKSMIEDVEG